MKNGQHAESIIGNQRHLFEIPENVVYLDCAKMGPQLRSVRQAAESALEGNAHPWNWVSSDWFTEAEQLREAVGKLVNADADAIALVPATSYGLAVAAGNLEAAPGDRILLIAEEFPSNIYTWRSFAARTGAEILTVRRAEGQNWTEAILSEFDESVKIVSVPNVHWTNGALIDLARVAERAHEVGAALIIDASQSLGALPIDVAALRPAYLVSVGYKWQMGPMGVSYLYVDEARREGRPIENNWINRANARDFAGLVNYVDEFQPGARRFDVGQRSNFVSTRMALAAVTQLLEWDVRRIARTLGQLTDYIGEKAVEQNLKVVPAGERGPHMLGIELPGIDLEKFSSRLAEEKIYVSIRGRSVRVAPHLYNSTADVDRFFEVLSAVL